VFFEEIRSAVYLSIVFKKGRGIWRSHHEDVGRSGREVL